VIQLIPLRLSTVAVVSPAAPEVVAQLDPMVRMGLAAVASLALLLVRAARLLSIAGAQGTARAIAVVGALLPSPTAALVHR